MGDRVQALALAIEQLKAQLLLQLLELLAETRLGSVHALGSQGDVEPGVGDRDEVAQLGQRHAGAPWWPARKAGVGDRPAEECVFIWTSIHPICAEIGRASCRERV